MDIKKKDSREISPLWLIVVFIIFGVSVWVMSQHLVEVNSQVAELDAEVDKAERVALRQTAWGATSDEEYALNTAKWSVQLQQETKSPERDAMAQEIIAATEDMNVDKDEYNKIKRKLIQLNEAKNISDIQRNAQEILEEDKGQS